MVGEVESIQTDCVLNTNADWERMLSLYSQDYWQIDPTLARLIVAELRDNDAIIHPRITPKDPITDLFDNNGYRHWIPA